MQCFIKTSFKNKSNLCRRIFSCFVVAAPKMNLLNPYSRKIFGSQSVDYSLLLKRKSNMYLQHSMGFDAACNDTVLPVAWLMWTLKTIRTRVFLRPMSVSPFRSSMSELRSFKIPAQSILCLWTHKVKRSSWSLSTRQIITCICDIYYSFSVNLTVIYKVFYSGLSQTVLKEAVVISTQD